MPALAPSIVFADEYLVVADKPAGLRSIPAGGEGRKDCLAARIRLRHADALIVHRLDAATSGLVLFARGAEMLRRMNRGFRERVVGKQYVALVHGHVTADAGEIALPLGPEPHRNPRQMVDLEHGQAALSRFRVLAREGDGEAAVTRLELAGYRSHPSAAGAPHEHRPSDHRRSALRASAQCGAPWADAPARDADRLHPSAPPRGAELRESAALLSRPVPRGDARSVRGGAVAEHRLDLEEFAEGLFRPIHARCRTVLKPPNGAIRSGAARLMLTCPARSLDATRRVASGSPPET